MTVHANIRLIRCLLDQIPAGITVELTDFETPTNRKRLLFGVREMLALGMIEGEFEYGEDFDPSGPFLIHATNIRLTKRGLNFK